MVINIEKKLTGNIYSLFDEVFSYYISNIDQAFEGKKSEKYVYDIFNKNSDFFASPCTPFASKYGTDILSVDRFEKFYTEINDDDIKGINKLVVFRFKFNKNKLN